MLILLLCFLIHYEVALFIGKLPKPLMIISTTNGIRWIISRQELQESTISTCGNITHSFSSIIQELVCFTGRK
jgi:hypothetical protein